ncbi:MAG: viroplasmin family protein [Bacteroidota bacterium]
MAAKKFYVVWKGRTTGVFDIWDDCFESIQGFPGAQYKSFESKEIAEAAAEKSPWIYIGKNKAAKERITSIDPNDFPIFDSMSVDAACSGNPGALEYRGVDTRSGKQLFHQGPFPEGTVNIGEFLAIVHGLAYLKKHKSSVAIYSDSLTARKWVKDKAIRTNLVRTVKNDALFQLVDRGIIWLKTHSYTNPILTWKTKVWGEIPADFGRK